MIFTESPLAGAYVVDIEMLEDDRGFFARSWCQNEFKDNGLNSDFVQCNISLNRMKGTLRGMHYQVLPHEEIKLVRCTKGSIYDVIVDLRTDSESYKKWYGCELTADNHRMLYVPKGFAHGFQTLEDNSEVFYQMSEFYQPECSRGVRWDDPAFSIEWPESERVIFSKDLQYQDFHP